MTNYLSEEYWESEIAFWGIHNFVDAWDSLGCGRCGNGYHDPVHKEANTLRAMDDEA